MRPKINTEAKSLICKALRSGTFKQGEDFTINDNQTCVGGVVVQTCISIYGKNRIARSLTSWTGLSDTDINQFADWTELLNKSLSFAQIADKIEYEW